MERIQLPNPAAHHHYTILVAEDNLADTYVMKAALEEWFNMDPPDFSLELQVYPNGLQAINFLKSVTEQSTVSQGDSLPDLIILNINMPVMNGLQALRKIKEHTAWRLIPTVMYSTSNNQNTVIDCHHAHANAYLIKPINFDQTIRSLRRTIEFFLGIALPVRLKPA